jgi:branched-chain amino acid transport system substrate-binding protein
LYSYPAQPPKPKSRSPWLILGGLGLVGALCLCIIALVVVFVVVKPFSPKATPTSTPTSTPRPTRTPRPSPTPSPSPVQIAFLLPLSGPVPTFGESTRAGALLAINEWNARGGVLGMPIVPIVEDSQCTADPAVNAASKVIDVDKVHYIIGEICSSASIPVSEIANTRGVVQISPASTRLQVTTYADGTVKPYSFIFPFSDEDQGKGMALFASETLHARTAFIMYDENNSYVKTLAEYFEKYFIEAGGMIVGKETYGSSDTDFTTVLDKIADASPDLVLLPDFYLIVNMVTGQAKDKGLTVPFIGGDGWDSSALDLAAVDGSYFLNHFSIYDQRPVVQNFVTSYGEAYKNADGTPKQPDVLAALAYDSTNLLLAAIEKAGVDDPAIVKDVLAGMSFEGVTGQATFNPNHTPHKSVSVMQILDGEIVFLETVQP